MSHVIEMLHVRKEFPGIVGNDDITLQVEKGEMHAILGENGAGKSTLMSICSAVSCRPGVIKLRGEEVRINSPNDATDWNRMVHQPFQLSRVHGPRTSFSARRVVVLDRNVRGQAIKALSEQYGLSINPDS